MQPRKKKKTFTKILNMEGEYEVVEKTSYSHSNEKYYKVVLINGETEVITSNSRSGPWRLSSLISNISIPDVKGQN